VAVCAQDYNVGQCHIWLWIRTSCLLSVYSIDIQMVGIWFAFAPIEVQVAHYYSVSNREVNSLSQVFMFVEIPLLILALWIYGMAYKHYF
jgi:hypothetical protein